ncbi:hypothetical protein C8R41DRAFT_402497 [Lentinula lateritia]|uniref:Uncharacterized protein n=1 Tax=Lentinula lateritia TaxID=40482 RepID=A0ABQ8VCQ2_9AGAR|nr:hypothetical protein C8R41DRAFT_402497 [Lentinula lateritia]
MSTQYDLVEKPFPPMTSPNSAYSFDFGRDNLSAPTTERWHNSHRSRRSASEHTLTSSPRQSWEVQPFNTAFRASQNIIKNTLRVDVRSHAPHSQSSLTAAPSANENNISFVSPSLSLASSTWWSSSSSSSSPAISTPFTFSSPFVKKEEPDSPQFIIEPLLPSSLVTKRSSSSSPEPCSSPTQAELESQLLLSQALAPPTEVPLRATQACDDMRQMMRSFRLNPFSIFTSNGKDLKSDMSDCSDSDPVVTWCGEIAKPLDEEPLIFEWQLDDYRSGLEGELPQLIVLDDVECSLDITGPEDSLLEATPREDPESPMIFSPSESLLPSEVASRSGFSTPVETEFQCTHVGLPETLPNTISFFPNFGPKQVETKQQRDGSYDSGYESNASVLTNPLPAYDPECLTNSFHGRSLDSGTYNPSFKKPRFSFHTDDNRTISPTSRSYNREIAFHTGYTREPPSHQLANENSLHTVRELGSDGSLNISRHSKALAAPYTVSTMNSGHDLNHKRASYGSMYIPTLLNTDSPNIRVPPSPYPTSYGPFTQSPTPLKFGELSTRMSHPSTTSSDSPTSTLSSSHPAQSPSTQDVMNVNRIWSNAANPQPDPNPSSELTLRQLHRQQQERVRQYHSPALSMLNAAIRPGMAVSSSLPPLCYLGQQQQQLAHLQAPQGRTLLSPLTSDAAHTRLRTSGQAFPALAGH